MTEKGRSGRTNDLYPDFARFAGTCRTVDRRTAVKRRFAEKKQTKTQTDNTAQKEDKTEAENTQTPVYDFVCSDGTLSAEFQQTLSDRAKEDKKYKRFLQIPAIIR